MNIKIWAKKHMKMSKREVYYFVIYGIFLFFTLLSTSFYYAYYAGTPLQIISLVCVFLLLLMEILLNRMTKRAFLISILCILMTFILAKNNVGAIQNTVTVSLLFVFCARDISFEKIGLFSMKMSLALLIFIIVSSQIGVIQNFISYAGGRTRHYLGFRYALYAPTILLNIITLYVYLHKNNISVVKLFLLGILSYWVYLQTDSRLTFYSGLLILGTGLVINLFKNISDKERKIFFLLIPIYPICFVGSIVLSQNFSFSKPWMIGLNTVLGNRIYHGWQSIRDYGISWLGSKSMEWRGNSLDAFGNRASSTGTYYVDNMYVMMIQRYGVIFCVIFSAIILYCLYQCYKQGKYLFLLIFAIISIHAVIDDLLIYPYNNTFWFIFGEVLYEQYPARRKVYRRKILNKPLK